MHFDSTPAVVLQLPPAGTSTVELGAARSAAVLLDVPVLNCGIDVLTSRLAEHPAYQALLGGAVPVGSVEFVRAAMGLLRIELPQWNCYPPELAAHLHRKVWAAQASDIQCGTWTGKRVFIKPMAIKRFTGFVYDGYNTAEQDAQELMVLGLLPAAEPVWMAQVVSWASEYRYYVAPDASGQMCVLGRGRYDQHGEDDAPEPDWSVVRECVAALPFMHPCAIDMGVLSSGKTALVEVNDAWSIGLYERALAPREYLGYLAARWQTIRKSS